MKFEIGTMSVGDVLDRGLKVLFSRLPAFYLVNLTVLAPLLAGQLLQGALQTHEVNRQDPGEAGLFLIGMLIALGLQFLGLVLQPLGLAATLYIVWQEFLGHRAGIGASFRFAFSRFLQLFLTSLMRGLVLVLGFFVGICLCLVPWFVLWVWFMFVPEIIVVEGTWGPESFTRSKELGKGHYWRILGLLALLLVAQIILIGAFSAASVMVPYYEQVPTEFGIPEQRITNFPLYALIIVGQFLVNIVAETYWAVCWTLFYFDLRFRKEGFDLEQAAQQPATNVGDNLTPEAQW